MVPPRRSFSASWISSADWISFFRELVNDVTFSFCHLYSVYRFLFSCHNKRPPYDKLFYHRRPFITLFTEKVSHSPAMITSLGGYHGWLLMISILPYHKYMVLFLQLSFYQPHFYDMGIPNKSYNLFWTLSCR